MSFLWVSNDINKSHNLSTIANITISLNILDELPAQREVIKYGISTSVCTVFLIYLGHFIPLHQISMCFTLKIIIHLITVNLSKCPQLLNNFRFKHINQRFTLPIFVCFTFVLINYFTQKYPEIPLGPFQFISSIYQLFLPYVFYFR